MNGKSRRLPDDQHHDGLERFRHALDEYHSVLNGTHTRLQELRTQFLQKHEKEFNGMKEDLMMREKYVTRTLRFEELARQD